MDSPESVRNLAKSRPASSSVDNTRNSARQRDSLQGVPEYHSNLNDCGGNLVKVRAGVASCRYLPSRVDSLLCDSGFFCNREHCCLCKTCWHEIKVTCRTRANWTRRSGIAKVCSSAWQTHWHHYQPHRPRFTGEIDD